MIALSPAWSLKNVNLVQSNLAKVKERPRTLLVLALVRARVRDFATVRVILDLIEKEGTPPQMKRDLDRLTEYVAKREAAG